MKLARRSRTAGASWVLPVALLLVLIIAVVLVFWFFTRGREPEYAHLADGDALFYMEGQGLDAETLTEEIAASRLVSEDSRSDLRRYLKRHLSEKDDTVIIGPARFWWGDEEVGPPPLNHYAKPAEAISMASYPADYDFRKKRSLRFKEIRMVSVLKFASQEDRRKCIKRHEAWDEEYQSWLKKQGGKQGRPEDDREIFVEKADDPTVLVFGDKKGDVERALAGLKERRDGNLAENALFKEAIAVNRGDGVFGFVNLKVWWKRILDVLKKEADDNKIRELKQLGVSDQGDFVKGLKDLLPDEKLGGLGVWLGLHESRAVLGLQESPLTGLPLLGSGGESLLAYFPKSTVLVVKMSVLPEGYEGLRDALKESSSRSVDVLDDVRDFIAKEVAGKDGDPDALIEAAEAALQQATGQFAFGLVDMGEGESGWVVAIGIKDKEAVHEAVKKLRRELKDRLQKDMESDTIEGLSGYIFDEDDGAMVIDDEAAVFYMRKRHFDRRTKKITEYFEDYWKARKDENLLNSPTFESALDGVDPGDPGFVAVHPHALAKLSRAESERWREENRERRTDKQKTSIEGGDFRPPKKPSVVSGPYEDPDATHYLAKDAWIGVSASAGSSGLEAQSNVGYADLLVISHIEKYHRDKRGQDAFDLIEADALKKAFEAYLARYVERGQQNRVYRWDFFSSLDQESREVLERMPYRSVTLKKRKDGAQVLLIKRPSSDEKIEVVVKPPEKPKFDHSHCKKDQEYEYELQGGSRVFYVVTRVDRDHLMYRIDMYIPATRSRMKGKKESRWPPPGADRTPTKKTSDPKSRTWKETIEVSGIKFRCTVTETQQRGKTTRTWVSEKFPTFIKSESDGKIVMALRDIR